MSGLITNGNVSTMSASSVLISTLAAVSDAGQYIFEMFDIVNVRLNDRSFFACILLCLYA